ncbi:MAG: right-handed parallel beta-helix repeat-containing protein [Planctomycetes bacterium]|nr:right-handed parallel beta-helix repeat-containing protein [Planctomycetota bacterium]
MSARLLALALCLGLATPGHADDFYVDGRTGADRPENGRSWQTPWKTIAYALARIPTPSAPASHTLHVAGGQTYSAASNGESFPLTVRPGVAIVGSGTPPVLSPVQRAALTFAYDTAYPASTRIARLVFQGWTMSVAPVGVEHAPRFESCRFENTGIELYPADGGRAAPWIEACEFSGSRQGILVWVAGGMNVNPIAEPRIVECVFRGHTTGGVYVDHGHDGPQDSRVDVRIQRCRFEGGDAGVLYVVEYMAPGNRSAVSIQDSSFHGMRLTGVQAMAGMGGHYDSLTVEGCRFLTGSPDATAVALNGGGPGSFVLLRHNLVAGGAEGVHLGAATMFGDGLPRTILEDLLIVGCAGNAVFVGASGRPVRVDLLQCRLLGNTTGLRVWGDSPSGSTLTLSSSLVAGGADGVTLDTNLVFLGHGVTVADNKDSGLRADRVGSNSAWVHGVAAGNGAQLTGKIPARYSLFHEQPVPGTGNQSVDPRLLRPSYKLAPDSPCIDAGDPLQALPASDYEGDPRLVAGPGGHRPDLGADEYVPWGGVRLHGLPGFGADALLPRISSANQSARLGDPLDVQVRDARSAGGGTATAVALQIGLEEAVVDLAPLGAPGSLLWTVPIFGLPPQVPDLLGVAAQRLLLPRDSSVLGLPFHLQWLVAHAGANAAGVLTTDALRVTLGR